MTKNEIVQQIFNSNTDLKSETKTNLKAYNFNPALLHELKNEDVLKEWIWEEYIAKGHATMLSAMYKAGKSTFLRGFLAAMQSEEEFVGMPVKRCNILIISEEHKADWVEKREEFGIDNRTNVHLLVRPITKKLNIKEWEEFISEVDKYCKVNAIELVIIDTLPAVWPAKDENSASDTTSALLPLNKFLNSNLALLFLWHFKKDVSGEDGTSSRGSSAIMAWVDCIVELKRLNGEVGNSPKRQITTLGRFEPQEATIEFGEDNKYIVLGTRQEVSKKARVECVKCIFTEHPEEQMCQNDVSKYLNVKGSLHSFTATKVNRYLKELRDDGFIEFACERLHKTRKVPYYKLKSISILGIGSNLSSAPSESELNISTQITTKSIQRNDSSELEVVKILGEHGMDELLDLSTPLYKQIIGNAAEAG